MAERVTASRRLDSWKDIASYLGRNVRTAIRWEQQRGLPIHRVPGGQRQAVFAWTHEIDAWLREGPLNGDDLVGHSDPSQESLVSSSGNAGAGSGKQLDAGAIEAISDKLRMRAFVLLGTAIVVAGVAAGAQAFRAYLSSDRTQFTHVRQITDDGFQKEGLVTNGKTIYFGEERNGSGILSSVSMDGGTIHEILRLLDEAKPVDISPDGKHLLVLARQGAEEEQGLWLVPVNGDSPKRIGQIGCHSAAWSPDGKSIAFAEQNGIYLTTNEGATPELIQTFDGVPDLLRWSLNGDSLRFFVRDSSEITTSAWELKFAGPEDQRLSYLAPIHLTFASCCAKSISIDKGGRSFVVGGDSNDTNIYLIKKHLSFAGSHFSSERISSPVSHPSYLFQDPLSDRILAIGDSAVTSGTFTNNRIDLVRFNEVAKNFLPFLPGIMANDLDFSRDGKFIAYVQYPGPRLVWSHSDGQQPREFKLPFIELELPRWAPDGRSIAFMARLPEKPWRIYIVSVLGGDPKEASVGFDNQGAPTWSPDGKRIVYGNVRCQEAKTCAIHMIDLSSRQQTTLPESDGLGTARWSPDGKYIAALDGVKQQVLVFDVASQRWHKVCDAVNGNDLSWSGDSRLLFASRPDGNHPEILRIALADGRVEPAVDLSSFAKSQGNLDMWFSLAPDGSIVFTRGLNSNEIYSFEYPSP